MRYASKEQVVVLLYILFSQYNMQTVAQEE